METNNKNKWTILKASVLAITMLTLPTVAFSLASRDAQEQDALSEAATSPQVSDENAYTSKVGKSTSTTADEMDVEDMNVDDMEVDEVEVSVEQETYGAETSLTREIREEIMEDDTLTMKAKNVTITTANGQVTLQGEVETQAEKERVVNIAQRVAGVVPVQNNLEVSE